MTDMENEVNKKESSDELTQRKANSLGEQQQKLEQMAEREQSAKGRKMRLLYYLIAVAACVAAVVLLWPTGKRSPAEELGIGVPTMIGYRSASPIINRIEKFISEEKYEDAIRVTEKALKNSDLAIYELENIPEIWEDLEEMAYEDNLARVKNAELRWTYIFLLIQMGRNKEARKELKTYLKEPQYCVHEEEARNLLKQLRK